MQTVEFSERLTNILKTLQLDAILHTLRLILEEPANVDIAGVRKSFPALIFATKANLQALSTDASNREIISALGFDGIFEPEALGQMITALNTQPNTHGVRNITHYYQLFYQLYSALRNLQRFQQVIDKFLIQPNKSAVSKEELALEFEIVDVGNRGIGFDRFEAVLKSIHALHDVVARALEVNGRLAIAYLDSGSNSIISIKTDHRIVDSIRKLISEVWDKIRFGKYDKMDRKLEAAEAGLKFVEMVLEKEKAGNLDPAISAQLRHVAIEETLNLFGKGTSLREIQTQTTLDNRSLLLEKFDIKLIEAGSGSETNPPASNPTAPPEEPKV